MIFISYRHDDRLHVRSLQAALEARVGRAGVLRDITSPTSQGDLRDVIGNLVADADTVLAVIGPRWHRGDSGPFSAAAEHRDWVRFELSLALAWRKEIIPVLFEDAQMPARSELPPDLADLADVLAVRLRDSDWEADLGKLYHRLGVPPIAQSGSSEAGPTTLRNVGPVAGRDVTIKGDNAAGRDLWT